MFRDGEVEECIQSLWVSNPKRYTRTGTREEGLDYSCYLWKAIRIFGPGLNAPYQDLTGRASRARLPGGLSPDAPIEAKQPHSYAE